MRGGKDLTFQYTMLSKYGLAAHNSTKVSENRSYSSMFFAGLLNGIMMKDEGIDGCTVKTHKFIHKMMQPTEPAHQQVRTHHATYMASTL